MIRRPPRSTHCISSAASDVYKRQLPSGERLEIGARPGGCARCRRPLLGARNPLIYAGEGVIYAGASDELKGLGVLVNVPVITTLKA